MIGPSVILGLTGSIGMGKTTTAALFAQAGARVYDADAAVHALYARGGGAVELLGAAFPGVVREEAIDRDRLSAAVLGDAAALARLEAIVHPLGPNPRAAFLAAAASDAAEVVVFDVPLLFETGGDRQVDAVVVVSCPSEMQRARVLARPGMTLERFDAILARQWPDAVKCERADFIVDTSRGIEAARSQVEAVVARVRRRDFTPRVGVEPGLDRAGDAPHDSPDGA